MQLDDLQGKLVAVLGYGIEGQAVTKYLLKHGIKPVLFDNKPWDEWSSEEQTKIKKLGVNFIFGPDSFKELKGFDVAFRSPGIKLSELAGYKLRVTSQTKFFFDNCPSKIIGITGTKGKGTTSSLIYEILNSQLTTRNSRTYLTGNIGKTQPLEIIDDLKADDWIVYELSSFQLQDLDRSPNVAVVLMITSEHLDYHKDTNEYVQAKSTITKYQMDKDFAVVNSDFKNSIIAGENGDGKKYYFSIRGAIGADCYAKDGEIFLAPSVTPILKASDLQLRGEHNLENVCAAILVAKSLGVDENVIVSAVKSFKGLEHRLELVAEKQGIKFYNDSFSTTPETAIAAIRSFTEPLVVILGGSSKNSDFTELGKVIAETKNIKHLILVGEEAQRINNSIPQPSHPTTISPAKTMPQIFQEIKKVAVSGDVVLLSPACASYDMFKNYKERGEQFKPEVNNF